jgi:hypothetical protein
MFQRILILTLLALQTSFTYGQEGDFFVTNYSPRLPGIDHLYFDIQFSSNQEVIVAHKSGILRFDGADWRFTLTPSAALNIALDDEDRIYVGCAGDFGTLGILDGQYQYKSLAFDSVNTIILQSLYYSDKIYFLQENRLVTYDPETEESTVLVTSEEDEYYNLLFEFQERLYLQSSDTLYQIGSSISEIESFLPDSGQVVISQFEPSSGQYAMASDQGNLWVFKDEFEQITIPDEIIVTDIAWTSPSKLALTTYSQGILFIDPEKNEQVGLINGGKGLPDNEIFAVAPDDDRGLWVANSFGLTRIAPEIPIRSFNYYPGLEGNLISLVPSEDSWFVATSTGVYYFDKVEKYKNTVYYVPKKTTTTTRRTTSGGTQGRTNQKTQEEKKGKRSFSVKSVVNNTKQVFSTNTNKSDNKKFSTKKDQEDKKGIFNINFKKTFNAIGNVITPKNKTEYIRKTRRELISTEYLYRSMDGLNEKSKQLIPFNDQYLASTPSGIVEIKEKIAHEIYPEPVRYLFHPEGSDKLVISTLDGGIKVLESYRDLWLESYSLETPGELILTIYEDKNSRIWLAGANNLFHVTLQDTMAVIEAQYALSNQFLDAIKITEIEDKIYLINDLGYFYVNEVSGQIESDDELLNAIGLPERHLIQRNGLVWIYNGLDWYRINADKTPEKFTYLRLFPNMSFVDELEEDLWLIDNNERLFKYQPGIMDSIWSGEMYYQSIKSEKGILSNRTREFKFNFDENSLLFEMARPDYLGLLNIEYQYLLSGFSDQWSEWSSNSKINFNFLPPGNYQLMVRSRDAFGREQESEPISIKIKPPYWETMWFNAAEVLFFTLLVFGSAQLNRRTKTEYALLTNLLTVLTIVLIIEFLQNTAGSYFGEMGSPVLAFGIDVTVALLVFPVEQLLKKFVTRGGRVRLKTSTEDKE